MVHNQNFMQLMKCLVVHTYKQTDMNFLDAHNLWNTIDVNLVRVRMLMEILIASPWVPQTGFHTLFLSIIKDNETTTLVKLTSSRQITNATFASHESTSIRSKLCGSLGRACSCTPHGKPSS